MVVHISVHMGYVNTIGLERLGFTADTKVPGGEIVLDGNGVPTGLLLENAIIEASGRLPVPTEDQVRESLVRAIAEYNKKGFTTFQDGGLGINGEAEVFLRPYMELAREGRLNARAYLQLLPSEMDKLIPLGLWGIGNDHMKIGGVKYFTDGSIQGFTGALLEDYYTRPGYKGALLWSQEEIDEIIIKYHWPRLSGSPCIPTATPPRNRSSKLLKRPWSGARARICATCLSMRSSFPTRSLSA